MLDGITGPHKNRFVLSINLSQRPKLPSFFNYDECVKPRATGREARKLPLCHASLTNGQKYIVLVLELHREFLHAGSDVMQAFTFYASEDKLDNRGNSAAEKYTGYAINRKAAELAKQELIL